MTNTNHDKAKIEEIINNLPYEYICELTKDCFPWIEEAMKEYADYIREKTIKECMECVPEEMNIEEVDEEDKDLWAIPYAYQNACIEITLNNMSNLIKN